MRYGSNPIGTGNSVSNPNDLYLQPGSGNGPVVLNNVAGAKLTQGSTQAVNGGQVYSLGSNLAAALGGGAVFNETTGSISTPTYAIQGSTKQGVGQAFQAVDTALTSLGNQVSNLATATRQVAEQVDKNRKIAAGGVAGAIASSQVRYDDRPGKASLGLGGGFYDGQGAFAVGFGATSENGRWRVNASVNYAPGIQKLGAGGGVSFSW